MGLLTALLFGFLSLAALNAGFCNGGCVEKERQALLRLKLDMVDPTGRLATWVADDEDCCRWKGVVCNNVTGHVIKLNLRNPTVDYDLAQTDHYDDEANERSRLGGKISSSLLDLKHLHYLDLSNNYFMGIHIPKFVGSLRSLRLLNLSSSGFAGEVPHHLGNLSNLKYLNLGENTLIEVENFYWLSGLSSLQYLNMNSVNLSKASNWFHVVNALPSLLELHLVYCQLGPHDQVHPITNVNLSSLDILDLSNNPSLVNFSNINWVFGLKKLIFLDLSKNYFECPIPHDLQNLTLLRHLDLSFNFLNSSVPDWLDSLSHLEFLDLSYNHFEGEIPIRSIGKLCNLSFLGFSYVNLTLEISSFLDSFSKCISNSLESLHLDNCQLSGQLTNQLRNFKFLRELSISENSISGPIPTVIAELQFLKVLGLSTNKLNGSLPESFGQLANLKDIDISHNSFEGTISEIHFVNLTKLKTFKAHGNPSMILKVNPNWFPHFQILDLELGSWYLGPQFPQWLHSQKYLRYLDISNSRISDTVPNWFWEVSAQCVYLNISHNQIHGKLPSVLNSSHFWSIIDFSSNNFTGSLARFSSNVLSLDLSKNKLSDSLSNFLCRKINESMDMRFLNLRKNLLFGGLPDCWTEWKELQALGLTDNRLTGEIPRSIGALSNLVSLHLEKNNLSGAIPLSLSNCKLLEILLLSENELDGSIPPWMGHRLSNLKILDLGSNEFSGHIPNELCSLSSLQILNLAHNNLFGSLPGCIGNLSVLLSTDNHSLEFYPVTYIINGILIVDQQKLYLENAAVWKKGQLLEYDKILHLVKVMDFSGNNLEGEIPSEITYLQGLQSLNLSHNLFTGRIPEDIGNMRMLESADFSRNKLSGSIPESISKLTFLSYLNLSNNQLVGRIPSSTQLEGLNAFSYVGNKQLCGLPLADNCSSVNANILQTRGGKLAKRVEINWLFVSMTLGFIVGLWSVMSPLVISKQWRCMYYQFLEEMCWKIINKCF